MSVAAGRTSPGESQEQWRQVRRHLNEHRHELARTARRLHTDHVQIAAPDLLVGEGWLPPEPVPLERVTLEWLADSPGNGVDGSEPESAHVRPLRAERGRYPYYADALGELDRPRLFENRPSYRLLGVERRDDRGIHLSFGDGRYFDLVNVSEAVAHEFALASWTEANEPPALDELPLRSLIGDPCDLRRRPVIPAIAALTLRRERVSGTASFVLHRRDAAKVAHGGGLYQVMPAGMFQPSAEAPWNQDNDFDLWRSMVREYSEEFLGRAEEYGSDDAPIDYGGWPFYRAITDARRAGRVRAHWLGLGVDPLTMVADMLVAVVFDDDVFDSLFGELVAANDEGQVVGGTGIPFDEKSVGRFAASEPMQAAGAVLLRLAWRHRGVLL
ncbi:MAG: transcriptional regulator [Streptosporangiales bacterium]|nr:transcriptional regulator [Streptosporangiales bacterium]